jgi:glycosyltransferase 2 family protein
MKKSVLRWSLRLIGPLLFVLFLWRTDVNAIWSSLQDVVWLPVIISLALMPFFIVIKAWRWRIIMHELGLHPPEVSYLSKIYTVGLFLGGTTPGQSGDFAKALYLRDSSRPMSSLLFSIFIERLCDVAAMAVMALIGLAALAHTLNATMQATVQTATLITATIIFLMLPALLIKRSRDWGIRIARLFIPKRFKTPFDDITNKFAALDIKVKPALLLLVATTGSAMSTAIRIALLFYAMELSRIPLSAVLGVTGQISLLQALPISISGIGIRDAVLIALLQSYDYSSAIAIALSGLFLLINVQHIIIGFIYSLRYPIPHQEDSHG